MTRQHKEFSYYCLDRLKPDDDLLVISYNDGSIIHKVMYKIGLRAKIKHRECFVLYTESDKDLDEFIYIDVDVYYDNRRRFFNDILPIEELKDMVKKIHTINIFEFISLMSFINIYDNFSNIVEANWEYLNMDELIEI